MRRNPIAIMALVRALVVLLGGFGIVTLSDAETEEVLAGLATLYALAELLISAYQRSKVSPTSHTAAETAAVAAQAGATPEVVRAVEQTIRTGEPVLPGPRRG